ncbi:type I asparaginase [Lachnospiraceae bacterium WCA-9-b2]|uniref:asparaginase n=1 Tax=Sporofaciens musculi TaxID=2681861 RepID=A0A7X3MKM1_9FIRM|nr:asparaginase [Sporofaciens musculi]MXP78184.1 type I asparaginase [Sporofaciens musculi]
MKRILMIGTGGTIASTQTEYGLAPGLTPADILSYIPAVRQVCEVDTIQVCNLDSTNVTPEHWRLLARSVEENYEAYDGFVICHGTDTLAYTAAALSYMIRNSAKPIVITGAQKPIQMDVTDARTNLLDSFIYAADHESQNVNIVFDGKVIAGTRAKKERAKSYDAFSSINFPYLAVIQEGMIVRYIKEPPCAAPVGFSYDMKDSVYVLKLIPGMHASILPYLFEHYDCIVIESFGVGGIPNTLVQEFYREMKEWEGKGKYVVMTTQVANEGSNMTVYEVGKRVKQDFKLLEAYDMTLEAVITKMMWLMGKGRAAYERMKEDFYTEINHDILFTKRLEREG